MTTFEQDTRSFGDSDSYSSRPPADRLPPQDLGAEQSVLGGMLLSKDAIADVGEAVRGHDFYKPAHELIFDAVIDLYGRGEPADAITVADELTKRGDLQRIGGQAYLHELVQSVPTAANAGFYAQIVAERAVLRRLVDAGTKIVQMGRGAGEGNVEDIVNRAQAEVYKVADQRGSEDYVPLASTLEETFTEIEVAYGRQMLWPDHCVQGTSGADFHPDRRFWAVYASLLVVMFLSAMDQTIVGTALPITTLSTERRRLTARLRARTAAALDAADGSGEITEQQVTEENARSSSEDFTTSLRDALAGHEADLVIMGRPPAELKTAATPFAPPNRPWPRWNPRWRRRPCRRRRSPTCAPMLTKLGISTTSLPKQLPRRATVPGTTRTPSLRKTLVRCALMVASDTPRSKAICLFSRPAFSPSRMRSCEGVRLATRSARSSSSAFSYENEAAPDQLSVNLRPTPIT